MRKLTTILAAAAAPLAVGGVLLGTVGQASAAAAPAVNTMASVQQSAPSGYSWNAYFWNPNGHALTGPQQMPGGTVSLAGGYLAKVTADEHNANLVGRTITITGTVTGGPFTDQENGGDPSGTNPDVQLYFAGGGAGTSSESPDGYEGQQWWADANASVNTTTGTFTVTATLDPAVSAWSDYNGKSASDPANVAMFTAAASHVRDLGLSFGGGYFFENGVQGSGSLTITSITVGSADQT